MSNVIPFPTKTDDDDQPYAVLYDGDEAYVVPLITIRSMALGLVDRDSMEHYDLIMQLIAYDWLTSVIGEEEY